ncbi:MAG TPA: HAD family phosphatase [Chitinophagaceae bacterium]|jgi:HAD superfamily hydrolase (TIGR01509 family)|nr:HAD family phosphatase [Chitinophagaceae bacterium]HAN38758.1 HAD family phosphatase [Chitinophagaceae bacterium]
MPLPAAAIFDLDGTMVDNNPFHIKAWQAFYERRGRILTEADYKTHINGRTNADVVKWVFEGEPITDADIAAYTDEKESLYRDIYADYIKPVHGLLPWLHQLQQHAIPIAMATSGIPDNINFFFQHVPVQPFFSLVVNGTQIKKGKPDPEIYTLTAQKLGVNPTACVAFEDSVPGVQSALAAGMKVVAVTTTHTAAELSMAHAIIPDFSNLTVNEMIRLIENV